METTEIAAASDVTDQVLSAAEEAEEWFPERIDWAHFWDRLEEHGYSVADTLSPAARKIERHIRKLRAS